MIFVPTHYLSSLIEDDCPLSDLTTEGLGIGTCVGKIVCFPKGDGVVAGVTLAARLFELAGAQASVLVQEGEYCHAGRPVLVASGSAMSLHHVYKVAQTLMEYVSGIAGRTAQMLLSAREVNPTIQVALTRKHFPGSKYLSLFGAMAGGGIVHRNGLSDSILVFDQHRVFCQDMARAMAALKRHSPERKIAVEVDSAQEGFRFIDLGADIIQCERFSPERLGAFVQEAKSRCPHLIINAAGGVNAQNAAQYACAGVDVLVTTWPYFGRPFDIKMAFECQEG